jgi:hypothetical protein
MFLKVEAIIRYNAGGFVLTLMVLWLSNVVIVTFVSVIFYPRALVRTYNAGLRIALLFFFLGHYRC